MARGAYKAKGVVSKTKYYDPVRRRRNYLANRKSAMEYERLKMSRVKTDLYAILGNKCSNPACLVPGGCADIRCLQIDHIHGGGTKERYEEYNNNNYKRWKYYVRHPDEAKAKLQILCANCNWIKIREKNEVSGIWTRKTEQNKKEVLHLPLTSFISN